MIIRSFVAWVPRGAATAPGGATASPPAGGSAAAWRRTQAGAIVLWVAPRSRSERDQRGAVIPDRLVLGDDSEWSAAAPDAVLAGGVPIAIHRERGEIGLTTSLVGLPPVFFFRGPEATAVASDIALLAGLPGVRMELDPRGVTELGRFGHPVERRTLFRDVEMAPSGARVTLRADGTVSIGASWRLPEAEPLPWPDFVEAQIAAFTAAVHATDVSRSFLSLTAGLDTRTVLAALAAERRLVAGVTMTGRQRSLDARIARRLCESYGVAHEAIVIDAAFRAGLPALVERAARLSGGLGSVSQAPEVFLYEQLAGRFESRVSGNLGNQVGRGGTEGVSIRGADLGILAPALRHASADAPHWLLSHLEQPTRAALEFILTSEIAFSSVGNYTVGNHFAVQQSPYASRPLIELLARRPSAGSGSPSGSKLRMRLRDLRHRFLGEPERVSFQRTLVRRLDGPAARVPVTWGWRPAGAPSPTGLVAGAAALAGMLARAKGLDDGTPGPFVRWTGIPALHDFRESRRWLREDLRSFTMDTLATVDAPLFDRKHLDGVLAEHFAGRRDHYETVTFALDLALAQRLARP